MQQPPPQMGPPPAGNSAVSGMDKKTAATITYLVTWITGVIFLFVGKNDPDIKFHAARAIVTFLPMQILITLASLLPSPVSYVATVIWIGYIVTWIFCLYKAWTENGARFEIPFLSGVVDPLAESLASKV